MTHEEAACVRAYLMVYGFEEECPASLDAALRLATPEDALGALLRGIGLVDGLRDYPLFVRGWRAGTAYWGTL